MSKTNEYALALSALLDAWLNTGDPTPIGDYLAAHSNLPGPRGNLELAACFARMVAERGTAFAPLCTALAAHSAEEAPVNSALEYLPFCGAWALGALGGSHPSFSWEALAGLRLLANDSRWRMREAVANGLTCLIALNDPALLAAMEDWITPGEWLAMRAVAAGVADPPTIARVGVAAWGLRLHERIFDMVRQADPSERKSDAFKALRQGLGYTLSVVTCGAPEGGFALLRWALASGDRDLVWIARENLKKNRLLKGYPDLTAQALALLS